jgi:hypothetical protein
MNRIHYYLRGFGCTSHWCPSSFWSRGLYLYVSLHNLLSEIIAREKEIDYFDISLVTELQPFIGLLADRLFDPKRKKVPVFPDQVK